LPNLALQVSVSVLEFSRALLKTLKACLLLGVFSDQSVMLLVSNYHGVDDFIRVVFYFEKSSRMMVIGTQGAWWIW